MPVTHRAAVWLMCASPLVWVPGGFDRFVLPKLLLATAAIACGALSPQRGRLPRGVVVLAAVGLAWFTLACLVSPTPVASFVGRWPRYEGVPVLLVYVGCAWLGARLLGDRSERSVTGLLNTLAVSSLALAACSALTELGRGLEGDSVQTRSGSVLGNATDQGLVAMLLLAVLFAAAVDRRTPLLLAGTVAAAATLVLSGSRTAALAAVVAVAVQVVVRRRELARPALAALGVLVVLGLLLPQLRDRIGTRSTLEGRALLWKQGIEVGMDRWLVGGPSTFIDASGRFRDATWVRVVGVTEPPDSAHSWVLQALDAGGVPLLIVTVALAGIVLRVGWRAVRRDDGAHDVLGLGALGAVVGYGVGLLPNFTIAGTTCLAAFLAGALVAEKVAPGVLCASGVPDGDRTGVTAARATAVVAVVGVVLLAAATVAERSVLRGIEAAGAGDLAGAGDAFDTARRLRPYDGDVAMFAAQAHAAAIRPDRPGSAEQAEVWARRSLARTPDTYAAALALAVAHIGQDELTAARDGLDRLVRLFPTEPEARIQLGIVRFGLRDVGGARVELRRAHALDPTDSRPTQLLEQIDRRLGAPG